MAMPLPSSLEPEDSESTTFNAPSLPGVGSSVCCSSRIAFSDPAIKLFGKMIVLPPVSIASSDTQLVRARAQGVEGQKDAKFECDVNRLSPSGVDELGISSGCGSGSEEEDAQINSSEEKVKDGPIPDGNDIDVPVRSVGKISDASLQDAAPSKPDKLVPCPRCHSMDTKFCYFNNYNVNQPRYFCRNCQRYWTAGGTLRNVPVGAGRRKNKHSNQHGQSQGGTVVLRRDNPGGAEPPLLSCSFRRGESKTSAYPAHSTSELCIPSVEDGYHDNTNPSSFSFSFAAREDVPITAEKLTSFSMIGVTTPATQSFAVQRSHNCSGVQTYLTGSSEISNITEATAEPTTGRKDGSTSSTATASASETGSDANFEGHANLGILPTATDSEGGCNGVTFPVIGSPWPYMCMNWAGAPAPAPAATSWAPLWAQRANSAAPTVPGWCVPPTGFWQLPSLSGAAWSPQGWSVPWGLPWNATTVTAAAAAGAAPNGLGKRPREPLKGAGDGSLCIPKTLRIRDPDEAACTSILTTLGVDTKSGPLISTGIFNAFKPKAEIFQRKKAESNNLTNNLSQDDRHADPAAAMSSSVAFQESR